MASAIAIIHKRGQSPWLNELLDTIHTDYPVIVTNHEGWGIDGVRKMFTHTEFDEIFFLNETMLVKDNIIWDIVFEKFKGESVAIGENYLMWLGKYLRKHVLQTTFPVVTSKREDITLGEFEWNKQYIGQDSSFYTVGMMTDTFDKYEERHGRTNMVLENEYFIKYKATWDLGMLND
jgi:hypothetical protein